MRSSAPWKIVVAVLVVVGAIGWLTWTAVDQNKEYYVTIGELSGMGGKAYSRHLRVAGNVQPGSIERSGPNATFILLEQGHTLKVNYQGAEPPPDTFKDDSQALAVGTYGRDGVFHATQLQAKCASKYAPAKPGEKAVPGPVPGAAPASPGGNNTAMLQPVK